MTTFIVVGIGVVLFFLCVVLPACYLTSATHEQRAEAEFWGDHRPPATDDPQEWTGPLHTGGTGAEKRMRRYFHEHRQILVNRASKQTHRVMAVLDRRPRRSWKLRRPVWADPAPVVEAPLEPLPLDVALMGHRFDEWPPEPEMHAAPLAQETLPAAPADDEASPIGDALKAEMGRVPEHVREGDGEQGGDLPEWMEEWLAKPLPGDEPTAALSDTQWRGFPAIKDDQVAS